MPKLEKGSEAAKAWAAKMKKAREAKKSMKGGFLQPGEAPPSAGPIEKKGDGYAVMPDDAIDGGKVSLKKVGKAFSKMGRATTKLNPMSWAIENKKSRDAMIQSGKFTQDTALPAVVTAGMPLYYGTAGTAGMLLGGPMGSMAATKAADELYKEMVVKQGYDPRARQSSETVGAISGEVGKIGASQWKSGTAGKGMRKKPKFVIID